MSLSARHRMFFAGLLLPLSLLLGTASVLAQNDDPDAKWRRLTAEAVAAYRRGAYVEGTAAAEQALALARGTLGERHPDTLASLNNLAFLYSRQGRYGEAEPLYRQALQASR